MHLGGGHLGGVVVPKQWKEANVTAIFKRKGHKSDPGNYRPVSLTSQIGKIFERLIRDRIVRILEENNKLRDSQHGFRAKSRAVPDHKFTGYRISTDTGYQPDINRIVN